MNLSQPKFDDRPAASASEIADLKAAYEKQIAALEASLRTAEIRVALAEAKMRNAQSSALNQIELMRRSTSWRLTAPLRVTVRTYIRMRTGMRPLLAVAARRLHGKVMHHRHLRSLFRVVLSIPGVRRIMDATYRRLWVRGAASGAQRPAMLAARMGPRARAVHEQLLSMVNNQERH